MIRIERFVLVVHDHVVLQCMNAISRVLPLFCFKLYDEQRLARLRYATDGWHTTSTAVLVKCHCLDCYQQNGSECDY